MQSLQLVDMTNLTDMDPPQEAVQPQEVAQNPYNDPEEAKEPELIKQ